MKLFSKPTILALWAVKTAAYKLTSQPKNPDATPALSKSKMTVEIFKAADMEPAGSSDDQDSDCDLGYIKYEGEATCVEDPDQGPWKILLGVKSHGLYTISSHKDFLCRQTKDLYQIANNHPGVDSELVGHWTNDHNYVWKNHNIDQWSFHTREDGNIHQSYFEVRCTGTKLDCLSIGENGEFGEFINHGCKEGQPTDKFPNHWGMDWDQIYYEYLN